MTSSPNIKNPFEERKKNAIHSANHLLSACAREYTQLAHFYIQEKSGQQDLTHLQEKLRVVLSLSHCITLNSKLCAAQAKTISQCYAMTLHSTRHEFEQIPISTVESCLQGAMTCLQTTGNIQKQQQH